MHQLLHFYTPDSCNISFKGLVPPPSFVTILESNEHGGSISKELCFSLSIISMYGLLFSCLLHSWIRESHKILHFSDSNTVNLINIPSTSSLKSPFLNVHLESTCDILQQYLPLFHSKFPTLYSLLLPVSIVVIILCLFPQYLMPKYQSQNSGCFVSMFYLCQFQFLWYTSQTWLSLFPVPIQLLEWKLFFPLSTCINFIF